MGLLTEFLSFLLLAAAAGLANWIDNTYFDKDWLEAVCAGSVVFCLVSGLFCFAWGFVLMARG